MSFTTLLIQMIMISSTFLVKKNYVFFTGKFTIDSLRFWDKYLNSQKVEDVRNLDLWGKSHHIGVFTNKKIEWKNVAPSGPELRSLITSDSKSKTMKQSSGGVGVGGLGGLGGLDLSYFTYLHVSYLLDVRLFARIIYSRLFGGQSCKHIRPHAIVSEQIVLKIISDLYNHHLCRSNFYTVHIYINYIIAGSFRVSLFIDLGFP